MVSYKCKWIWLINHFLGCIRLGLMPLGACMGAVGWKLLIPWWPVQELFWGLQGWTPILAGLLWSQPVLWGRAQLLLCCPAQPWACPELIQLWVGCWVWLKGLETAEPMLAKVLSPEPPVDAPNFMVLGLNPVCGCGWDGAGLFRNRLPPPKVVEAWLLNWFWFSIPPGTLGLGCGKGLAGGLLGWLNLLNMFGYPVVGPLLPSLPCWMGACRGCEFWLATLCSSLEGFTG